jgi:hypothetical protein
MHEATMWLRAMRIHLASIASMNLAWETLHLPLYTIWADGTPRSQALAVLHCTGGDVLIATSALVLGLLLAGDKTWPRTRFFPVLALTVGAGLAYTIFSEWLNVVVRASWAYSAAMPVIPIFGLRIGLSPVLQWLVVPTAALLLARRLTQRPAEPSL